MDRRAVPFRRAACRPARIFGDEDAAALYAAAVHDLVRLGAQKVEIDFSLFRAAADLLYSRPWVAERLAAIDPFMAAHAEEWKEPGAPARIDALLALLLKGLEAPCKG